MSAEAWCGEPLEWYVQQGLVRLESTTETIMGGFFDWCGRERTDSILRRLAEPQWVVQVTPQTQGWTCPKCGRTWAPNWMGPCVCHEKSSPQPGEPQG